MAISFVGSKTFAAAGAASGTFAVSLTDLLDTTGASATLAQNDLIVINYVVGGDQADVALTPPTGYTEETELFSDDGADANLAVWRKFMGATPDTSVDIPNSTNADYAVAGTIFAFRGVDTTTPLDVAIATATGIDGGQPNPPSVTPTTAGAWIVVVGGSGHSTAVTAFGNPGDLSSTTNHFRSVTQADIIDATAGCGIKTDWTSGAFDPATWTDGSTAAGSSWCAATLALRPAVTTQTLSPSLFTNSQTFHAATVAASYTLAPPLLTQAPSFPAATVAASNSLQPPLVTNTVAFHAATVMASNSLAPLLLTNAQSFHASTIASVVLVAPSLLTNSQSFYGASAAPGPVTVAPNPLSNAQSFYGATVALEQHVLPPLIYATGPPAGQTDAAVTVVRF